MKNLKYIHAAFLRALGGSQMSEAGQESLLADLWLLDRCHEVDWPAFVNASDKRFAAELEDVRRYADQENLCFRDGYEPFYLL